MKFVKLIYWFVVDISHESFEDHIDSVNQILQKLMRIKTNVMVFNKIDAFAYEKKRKTI